MQTQWLPTPEEIEAAKAEIRSEWTETDMLSRGRLTLNRVTPDARNLALERIEQAHRRRYLKRRRRKT